MLISFLKYNLVQVVAYALELGVFFLAIYLFADSLVVSNVIAKGSAGLFAFFLHKYFTFKCNEVDGISGEAARYILVLIGNAFLGSFLLVVLAESFPEWISKISSDVLTVGVTFLLTHQLVFKKHKD